MTTDAELAVLGGLLIDSSRYDDVAWLREHDFSPKYRPVWRWIESRCSEGERVDFEVATDQGFDGVGLVNAGSAANIEYFAKQLRDASLKRQLRQAASDILEAQGSAADLLDTAEKRISELRETNTTDIRPLKEYAPGYVDYLDDLRERGGEIIGTSTGLVDLDRATSGLQGGDLIILAARPSIGKTSLGLVIAEAVSREKPVAFFSMEMNERKILNRLASGVGHIPLAKFRQVAHWDEGDWPRLSDALVKVSNRPFYLEKTSGISPNALKASCRRVHRQNRLGLVVVDYLQLMRPDTRSQNRTQEVGEISHALKALAEELDVPVICLSQLNRNLENRQNKRPIMADIRECLPASSLVLDADTGRRIRVGEIVNSGLKPNVWSLNDRGKLVRRRVVDSWPVGLKDMVNIRTRSGRSIRCSTNHKVYTEKGWVCAGDLSEGVLAGVPREYPHEGSRGSASNNGGRMELLGWMIGDGYLNGTSALTVCSERDAARAMQLARAEWPELNPSVKPERLSSRSWKVSFSTGRMCGAGKNPMTSWLRDIGAWGWTSVDKHVPSCVFESGSNDIASFLRGLFHADGSLTKKKKYNNCTVRLATISRDLAYQVQHLLLRVGLVSRVSEDSHSASGYRTKVSRIYSVAISDQVNVKGFMSKVGFLGEKNAEAQSKVGDFLSYPGSIDRLPLWVTDRILEIKNAKSLSHTDVGYRAYGKRISRERAAKVGKNLGSRVICDMASSDLYWDEVVSIETTGKEPCYDVSVEEFHNFCCDDFLVHNSGDVEQDADHIWFLYRDEVYNEDSPHRGVAELIRAKDRDGAIGTTELSWRGDYAWFANYEGPSRSERDPKEDKPFQQRYRRSA